MISRQEGGSMRQTLSLRDIMSDEIEAIVLLMRDGNVRTMGEDDCDTPRDIMVDIDELAAVILENVDGSLTVLDVPGLPPPTITTEVEVPVGNPTRVSYRKRCEKVDLGKCNGIGVGDCGPEFTENGKKCKYCKRKRPNGQLRCYKCCEG